MSKFQDYVPQPFPIYKAIPTHPDYPDELHYQNHRLSQCKGDMDTFSLAFPTDGTKIGFPAFMIRRPAGGAAITSWDLCSIELGSCSTLSSITSSIENLDETPDWEAVIFPSQSKSVGGINTANHYYLKITDGTGSWYSEVFKFYDSETLNVVLPYSTLPNPCDTDEWIQLVWNNPGCVISEKFPTGISFALNLAANVSQPEYEYVFEAEEDGEGGKVTTFQRMDKRWTFFILAPEFVADALSAMHMFSAVAINFQWGDTMNCRDIEVEVDWQTPCFGNVKVSFSADFLTRTQCCS